MKILVTGASGLLGRSLMSELAELAGSPGQLIGTARSRVAPHLRQLDLTDDDAVRRAFAAFSPELVVHCAAERRPDVVDGDPAAALRINVGATALLAELAAAHGARFIYISTDYVFDGTAPPYSTQARPAPLNAYGSMKLAGEDAVRVAYSSASAASADSSGAASGDAYAILRIPILYGRVETLAESPVTELAARLLAGDTFKAEDWAMRYPAHADDVARAVALIARQLTQATPGCGGIYHFAGSEQFTKYTMARVIAAALGIPAQRVQPDANPPAGAPRPKDCRLDATRLAALGAVPAIRFADGIRAALAPFSAAPPR